LERCGRDSLDRCREQGIAVDIDQLDLAAHVGERDVRRGQRRVGTAGAHAGREREWIADRQLDPVAAAHRANDERRCGPATTRGRVGCTQSTA
jgi:hypothetical protein